MRLTKGRTTSTTTGVDRGGLVSGEQGPGAPRAAGDRGAGGGTDDGGHAAQTDRGGGRRRAQGQGPERSERRRTDGAN
eukprot:235318-Prymnesium_polylepis.1